MSKRSFTAATVLPASPLASLPWPVLRWLPFVAIALFSLALSVVAPDGRKPFYFDWAVSMDAFRFSIVKTPHIAATALLAVLGVLGSGRQRWPLALVFTVAIGAGWELCQTTVVGHTARLSDLAPDTLGALLGCMVGSAGLWTIEPMRRARIRQ
jgi:VanZ family protein